MIEELQQIPDKSILNVELVHNHTKNVKDLLIVHCIMAWNGEYLIGKDWSDSRQLLEEIESGTHLRKSLVYQTGFWDLFQDRLVGHTDLGDVSDRESDLIEGIVLKKPYGKLKFSTTPIKDVSWMMKIRHPSKKYPF